MLDRLPGWVTSNAESVRAEVAEWRDLDRTQRWRLARACSRDALWALSVARDPRRILDRVDPLPRSSQEALARLRARAGWGDERP
ncbi:MAG: hypothetical protein IPK07_35120 [Deltaproteobacteria bacterium]|jgi:hypothetical protein|nr:hypothetical protein [Deltaproteobacteria bacterium]MCC6903852.1 hypothetical protein [Polyangiaceae bacterium]